MSARRPTADEHRRFLTSYEEYVAQHLNPARAQVKRLLEPWVKPEYWAAHRGFGGGPAPSPVHAVTVRIKRPEAVADKILRNPARFPAGLSDDSMHRMTDGVRARVLTCFVADLPLVAAEVASQKTLEISSEHPPRAFLREEDMARVDLPGFELKQKRLGTAALVYRLRFRTSYGKGPWFELQVRTLLEQLWADVQHQLGYRERRETQQAVRARYEQIAGTMVALERDLTAFYEELAQYQGTADPDDDARINAENLPVLLRRHGVVCAQGEVDGLLKVLASRGVDRVCDLERRLGPETVEVIRATYRDAAGWEPSSFEVVATIALLGEGESPSDVAALARVNLEYLQTWESLIAGRTRTEQEVAPVGLTALGPLPRRAAG